MLARKEIDPKTVYTLFFNGTDTYFQPEGYCSTYPKDRPDGQNRSETISFLATCIDNIRDELELPGILDTKTTSFHNGTSRVLLESPLPIRIIEGPKTLGENTHEKIASGVASILGSILEGKNIFNIGGHSRGAVESILVAWELQRIQDAMRGAPASTPDEQIWEIICGNPQEAGICTSAKNVRQELKRILAQIQQNHDVLRSIKQGFINEKGIFVNLFLIDPVPGNGILGLNAWISWVDPNMFRYPAIVRNVTKICCRNEASPCFDLLHTEPGPNSVITNHLLPGHHGTPTGNPFGRSGESLQDFGVAAELTTIHAQLMTLYLAIDFFEQNGSPLIDSLINTDLCAQYHSYRQASQEQREMIRLETYLKIQNNIKAFTALNKTSYISPFRPVGWEWIEAVNLPGQPFPNRPMIIDANNNKSNIGAKMPFNSKSFVNQDHLHLFLKIEFKICENACPEETISQLFAKTNYHKLINQAQAEIYNTIEEAIKNTITSLVHEYLQNSLSEERKTNIINAINRTLGLEFTEEEKDGGFLLIDNSLSSISNLNKIKQTMHWHLKKYLSEQLRLQVASYIDSLKSMVQQMRAYKRVDNLNYYIYIKALSKFRELRHFADNLTNLHMNIANDVKTRDFKKFIQRQITYIRWCANQMPDVITEVLLQKDLGLPPHRTNQLSRHDNDEQEFYFGIFALYQQKRLLSQQAIRHHQQNLELSMPQSPRHQNPLQPVIVYDAASHMHDSAVRALSRPNSFSDPLMFTTNGVLNGNHFSSTGIGRLATIIDKSLYYGANIGCPLRVNDKNMVMPRALRRQYPLVRSSESLASFWVAVEFTTTQAQLMRILIIIDCFAHNGHLCIYVRALAVVIARARNSAARSNYEAPDINGNSLEDGPNIVIEEVENHNPNNHIAASSADPAIRDDSGTAATNDCPKADENQEKQPAKIRTQPTTIQNSYTNPYYNMQILSGVILVVGAVAVVAAIAVLAWQALGITASTAIGAGGIAALTLGIFANRVLDKPSAESQVIDLNINMPPYISN